MAVVQNAYDLYKGNTKDYLKEVTNPTNLKWHNRFSIESPDAMCGYIGNITPDSGSDGINRIIIGLRGTNSLSEWITDGHYGQLPYSLGTKITGSIENGFSDIYTQKASLIKQSLRDQLIALLNKTYIKGAHTNNIIYITGHSLGAAVAGLIAADLSEQFPDVDIVTYTFASPRLGDPVFSNSFKTYIAQRAGKFVNQRVFNTEDIVPGLPTPIIDKLIFMHTDSFFDITLLKSDKNLMTGFSFTLNKGALATNHAMCTYLEGVSNGYKVCSSNKTNATENSSCKECCCKECCCKKCC